MKKQKEKRQFQTKKKNERLIDDACEKRKVN